MVGETACGGLETVVRLLLIPQVVTSELAAESDVAGYREMIGYFDRFADNWYYLWTKRQHEGKGLPERNVTTMFEEVDFMTFYGQMASVTGRLFELFNRIGGMYPVDGVLTSRAGLVPSLIMGLSTEPSVPVPVVTMEPRVYAPGNVAHNQVTDVDAAARAVGYALATVGVYWSEWELEAAVDAVSMWMSRAAEERVRERGVVVPHPVEVPDRLAVRDGSRKTLAFVGRLNPNKRWRDVLSAYAKVVMARGDTDVWVHSPTGLSHLDGDLIGVWHRATERLPERSDYLKLLDRVHVAAYASRDEGMNVTVMEMLAHGVVMVLPNAPWVMKLFHPLEYPFTFKSIREMTAMVDMALDRYDDWIVQLEPVREMIRRRFSDQAAEAAWKTVWDRIQSEVSKVEPIRMFRSDLEQVGGRLRFDTMLDVSGVGKHARPEMRRVFSNYAAYRAVADLDLYNDPMPILELR